MRLGLRLRAAGGAIAVLAMVAGCTSSSADGPTSTAVVSVTVSPSVVDPSSASPPPSSSDPSPSAIDVPSPTPTSLDAAAQEAADRAAIEAQWIKFWDVYQAIVQTSPEQRQSVAESVAVPELAEKLVAAAAKADAERKDNYGQVIHRIFWQFDVAGKQTAVIADCLDQSKAGTIDAATGAILTVGPERANMRGEMVLGTDGVWRVKSITSLNSSSC